MEIKKSFLRNTYIYVLSFLIIFSSGAILDQKYPNYSQALFIGLSLPLLIGLFFNKKYITYLLVVPILFILINYLNHEIMFSGYLTFMIKFITVLAVVHYCIINKISILHIINSIITGIAFYSLFTYFFLDVMKILPYTYEVINAKPYSVWYGIHFHGQETDWYSYRVVRNNSIFWEPGVLQMYLNFALIYQFFIKPKASRMVVFVLLVNMLTTFSTTGILTCAVIILVRYIKTKPKTLGPLFLKYYLLVPLLAAGVILGFYLLNQKMNAGGTRSYNLRMDDLLVGLQLFFEKPLFGWGFLNNLGYYAETGTSNNSNGFVSMLFHQGISGILFYLVPLFLLVKGLFTQKLQVLSVLIGIYVIISAAAEPLMYANYISFFFCMGVAAFLEKERFNEWIREVIFKERKLVNSKVNQVAT